MSMLILYGVSCVSYLFASPSQFRWINFPNPLPYSLAFLAIIQSCIYSNRFSVYIFVWIFFYTVRSSADWICVLSQRLKPTQSINPNCGDVHAFLFLDFCLCRSICSFHSFSSFALRRRSSSSSSSSTIVGRILLLFDCHEQFMFKCVFVWL